MSKICQNDQIYNKTLGEDDWYDVSKLILTIWKQWLQKGYDMAHINNIIRASLRMSKKGRNDQIYNKTLCDDDWYEARVKVDPYNIETMTAERVQYGWYQKQVIRAS